MRVGLLGFERFITEGGSPGAGRSRGPLAKYREIWTVKVEELNVEIRTVKVRVG